MKQVIAALVTIVLAVAALTAAPAPFSRGHNRERSTQLTPGDYVYSWGSESEELVLHGSGQYEADWIGNRYYGFWEWDRVDRRFRIWEGYGEPAHQKMLAFDRSDMHFYSFILDEHLVVVEPSGLLKSMKRGRKPVPEHLKLKA